jgi:hypothetical protein
MEVEVEYLPLLRRQGEVQYLSRLIAVLEKLIIPDVRTRESGRTALTGY